MQYILSSPTRYFLALTACGVIGMATGAALAHVGLWPAFLTITIGG